MKNTTLQSKNNFIETNFDRIVDDLIDEIVKNYAHINFCVIVSAVVVKLQSIYEIVYLGKYHKYFNEKLGLENQAICNRFFSKVKFKKIEDTKNFKKLNEMSKKKNNIFIMYCILVTISFIVVFSLSKYASH
ncbi:hypothetical protein [Campylobacter sp. MG1]|uniref:hypothetical protein n=1 Tax=Campylobacter sp. MG1 TaxID=2976332 RepID=UPI00226D219F|nr:hypothetical protein [Campylobacter sp. MG1]